jgi:tRNA (cytidine/uridine-2'-O-)-methyltransferase
VRIALYQPEIAQNVGSIIRLGQCFDMPIDLIHPLGFVFSSKYLKRAGMDYIEKAEVAHFDDSDQFFKSRGQQRIILFDTKGSTSLYDFQFLASDILLFGQESSGVPETVFEKVTYTIYIPIQGRSLNLAMSCAIGASHFRKQCSISNS